MDVSVSDKEFKDLHETELVIMDHIDKFCKENNIHYFLVGGSAIGALRHKGFIPWDDDIDIGMLREDYDKFISLYKDNDKFFLQCMEKDKKYWQLFAKMRKKYTYVEETRLKNLNVNKEIFVDIFPFDNAPDGGYKKIKIRANIIKLLKSVFLLKKKVKKLSECNAKFLNIICYILPTGLIYNIIKRLMTKEKNKDVKYCVSYLTDYAIKKEYIKKEYMVPTKEAKFENRKYQIPGDADKYLKGLWGDYMTLPPKEKRINHGVLKVITDTRGSK